MKGTNIREKLTNKARRRTKKLPEPYEVVIDSMSHEGRGIAHVNGKTVFVFGALEGERVNIQVQKTNRNFDQATALGWLL